MSDQPNEQSKSVITRYPPSPTGNLHIGSARTALFNFLFAKKSNGKMILRFEDTDKARSKKEFEQDIFKGLEWLKMTCDGVFHQSERTLVYRKHLEKMLNDGTAYFSETSNISEFNNSGEESEDDENTSSANSPARVIRFKNPNKVITFNDLVRGDISVDTTELGDFIIARSIEEPLYHFAVVVDDFEMGITHIIRGEDGIYNTPRQILLQEAIGATRPLYCHIPFVLGSNKAKLSKRDGATSVNDYKIAGYLPEAVMNYLALLGWNPGTDQEIFTLDELVQQFDLAKVQKSGAIFDVEKLKWINREHIKKMSDDTFKKVALDWIPSNLKSSPNWNEEMLAKIIPILRERTTLLKDITDMAGAGELDFFFSAPTLTKELLMPKGKSANNNPNEISGFLSKGKELLNAISEQNWNDESVKSAIWDFASEIGRGNILWPIRVALSGREQSPDPFTLAKVFGKSETLKRIDSAIQILAS